jgi:hypothetical protein
MLDLPGRRELSMVGIVTGPMETVHLPRELRRIERIGRKVLGSSWYCLRLRPLAWLQCTCGSSTEYRFFLLPEQGSIGQTALKTRDHFFDRIF